MFRLKGIDHVVLRVEDVDRTMTFYTGALGCTVDQARTDIGLYQLRAGDAIVDLVDVHGPLGKEGGPAPGPLGNNLDHFCVRIEPFDEAAIRRHFSRFGVEAGPVLNNWGADGRGPSMYVKDPSGNTIELKGPPERPYDPGVGYIPEGDET